MIPTTKHLERQLKRKKFLLIFSIGLLMIILVLFMLGGGSGLLRERIQLIIDTYRFKKASEKFYQGVEQYYQAFREDTYGGETPQETLNMFIEALEKGDIELASKYFAMDDNLSREKWERALKETIAANQVNFLIDILKKMEPYSKGSPTTTTYEFVFINKNTGIIDYSIEMKLNEYSGVWKIVSM